MCKESNVLDQLFKSQRIRLIEDFQKKSQGIQGSLAIPISLTWTDASLSLSIHLERTTFKKVLHSIPVVRTREEHFSVETPAVRQVSKKVGQYPEMRMKGIQVEVVWRDVTATVPETYIEKKDVRLEIPDFQFRQQAVYIPIPGFSLSEEKIVVRVPRFSRERFPTGAAQRNEMIDKLNSDVQELLVRLKKQLRDLLTERLATLFECYKDNLRTARTGTLLSFDEAIRKFDDCLASATLGQAVDAAARIQKGQRELLTRRKEVESSFKGLMEELETEQAKQLKLVAEL
ncbi:MAG: hypothetical protein L0387_28225 [Acidobacteria bacterium]|nr:hypothetical protein [Acidobacteriota bacterium]